MPPAIASIVCVLGILGLFWLDRDRKARTSTALWIPLIWLALSCSRSAAQWLQVGSGTEQPDQLLEGSPFDRSVYTGLVALGLIVLFNRRRQAGRLLRANWPILLFFSYCLVSLFWSDYPGVAFKRWIKAVGDLVMVLIIATDRDPFSAVKRLLSRLAFVLIPISILFIKYYPELGTDYSPWGGPVMYTGVTINKNSLGATCLVLGLGSLWRFLEAFESEDRKSRNRRLTAQAIILVMVSWLLWAANSMTSISCFLMASVLILVANLRAVTRKPATVHLITAAMLGASASIVFLGASPGALKAMGRNPTLTDRTEVWGWLFSLVRNPLLGTGFETFWLGKRLAKLWSIYWWHPNEAHNGYIEVYLNLGWIGLALLAIVLATGYRKLISAYRRNLPLSKLGLAYFLVAITYNFTEAALFKMLHSVWIFALFSIVGASAISTRKLPSSLPDALEQRKQQSSGFGQVDSRVGVV
jgi:exopolysaccharide production protein ExoQ